MVSVAAITRHKFQDFPNVLHTFANSLEPYEMLRAITFGSTLLPVGFGFMNETPFATMDISKFKDARVYFRNFEVKGLTVPRYQSFTFHVNICVEVLWPIKGGHVERGQLT